MKVYLGKLCVSSNLIQCKSAIHVICLSNLETCVQPPDMPDHAFNAYDCKLLQNKRQEECGAPTPPLENFRFHNEYDDEYEKVLIIFWTLQTNFCNSVHVE